MEVTSSMTLFLKISHKHCFFTKTLIDNNKMSILYITRCESVVTGTVEIRGMASLV